jgi:hypothetical protein
MIVLAVNMRLAKINFLRVGRGWGEINQHGQGENRKQYLLHCVIALLK